MPQHITLSELQSLIKRGIDDAHPLPYWVTAEISELKREIFRLQQRLDNRK